MLGQLLFVLYINDLPDSIKSFAKLFADDLKMIAKASDKLQVDNDLKMLELWESTWLLEFNVKKCKVLHTSFNNNPYNTYHLNGKVMLTSDQEKDLGVLTTYNLLWNDQINSRGRGSNPIFPKTHRNLDLGMGKMGKKYVKREGNKVSIFKIEKISIFAHDAPKFGLGMGKNGEKSIWKEREKVFVLTNCCTLLSLFSAF